LNDITDICIVFESLDSFIDNFALVEFGARENLVTAAIHILIAKDIKPRKVDLCSFIYRLIYNLSYCPRRILRLNIGNFVNTGSFVNDNFTLMIQFYNHFSFKLELIDVLNDWYEKVIDD